MRFLTLFLTWAALLPTLNGPVNALAVSGDRLLIGQGNVLIDAAIDPDTLTISHAVDLQHGAIRAIAVVQAATLVLSEEGISVLDASDTLTAFIAGGGQRLIVHGDRLYVAALDAGVTVYTFSNPLDGKTFKKVGHVDTSAEDIATESATWLWTASGADGLRLFDLTDPAHPAMLFESTEHIPAHLVRTMGARLYLGYANQLAVFDTITIGTPRLILDLNLGDTTASAGDLALDPKRALIGRMDVAGADVLLLDVSDLQAIHDTAHNGDTGSGDRLVLHGNDLFVGSERTGLRRLSLEGLTLTARGSWAASDVTSCTDFTPLNPQPPNLSLIGSTDTVRLSWGAPCLAPRYAILVNGVQVAVINAPDYTLTLHSDLVTWQIIALPGSGQTGAVNGARWSFEVARDDLMVQSTPPHIDTVLYHPPPVQINLRSPEAVLVATCGAVLTGLAVIIAGAVAIRGWFERRQV